MSYTLSELIQDAYISLGQLEVAKATGGTSSTVVDSKLQNNGKDDDWKGGTLIVIQAGGNVPEREFERIAASDDSAGELSLSNALTAAVEAGDTYGLASGYYPLDVMIEMANAGLRALGDIPLVDTTTLDSVSSQTEYAASLAWKRRPPVMIDYQGLSGHNNDNHWVRVYDWAFVPAAPGETGTIVFRREIPAVRDIRIWYVDSHPRVDAYDDVISESIVPDLAVCAVIERALRWQNSRLGGSDVFLMQQWQDAKLDLERARIHHQIWKPKRGSRLNLSGVLG